MGRAKRVKDQRAKARRVPHQFVNRWVVVGVDRWGEPVFENNTFPADTATSKAEAERIAEAMNRRGGKVVLVEQWWNSSYVGYVPVGYYKGEYAAVKFIYGLQNRLHELDQPTQEEDL